MHTCYMQSQAQTLVCYQMGNVQSKVQSEMCALLIYSFNFRKINITKRY